MILLLFVLPGFCLLHPFDGLHKGTLRTTSNLRSAKAALLPSGRGVKAFVPYPLPPEGTTDVAAYVTDYIRNAMDYVRAVYGTKWVDVTGKDLARACFLCHDAGALVRSDYSNG